MRQWRVPLANNNKNPDNERNEQAVAHGSPTRTVRIPDALLGCPAFACLVGYITGDVHVGDASLGHGMVKFGGVEFEELKSFGVLLSHFFPGLDIVLGRVPKSQTDAECAIVESNTRQGQFYILARPPKPSSRSPSTQTCPVEEVVAGDLDEQLVKTGISLSVLRNTNENETPTFDPTWWWRGEGRSGPTVRRLAAVLRELTYDAHGNRVFPPEFLNAPIEVRMALWHGFWVADGYVMTCCFSVV